MAWNAEGAEGGPQSLPLGAYRRVSTDRVDDAAEAIGQIFCPHNLEPIRGTQSRFFARHHCAALDGISVNYVAYGGTVTIDPGCLDRFFLLQVPRTGAARVSTASRLVETLPGNVASLLSPTVPTRMEWHDGCGQMILLIDRDVLEQRAAALAGAPRQIVEFDPALDLRNAAGRMLVAQLTALIDALDRPPAGRGLSRLAVADFREAFLSMLLNGQPHGLTEPIRRFSGQAPTTPAALRRARDHLRAHADEAFDLARLAAVAGTGIRALQLGFKRHFGTTISEMLLDIRLDHLNSALRRAADGASVTDKAYELGFTHLSRMAEAYRCKYGEPPSATLRRARRPSLQSFQA
ncbi:AraC family transcriptional regulator [Bradyrhizobium sp. WD16]|uniref:AraC family transcriptional regulator n=1 Tax=Bradyrhizobium sp. WD16 TaxID=1521768 RepID=UPI0020A246FF|nr:AraC family transcriptional regulator [Bradyrhizobium sp. WD16]UTD28320.1 transcriptional regulator [Bradyrhizobium sp. WD16]